MCHVVHNIYLNGINHLLTQKWLFHVNFHDLNAHTPIIHDGSSVHKRYNINYSENNKSETLYLTRIGFIFTFCIKSICGGQQEKKNKNKLHKTPGDESSPKQSLPAWQRKKNWSWYQPLIWLFCVQHSAQRYFCEERRWALYERKW